MCKKQACVLLQLVIIPCLPKSTKEESGAWRRGEEAVGEWKPWGARYSPSPYPIFFCFQITRINKLIISVVLVMGCSLLAASYNTLVTFIIFRDVLCRTLNQGVLGDALCKGSRDIHLPFQMFIFLSIIPGFYAVFIFFLLTYFPPFFPYIQILLLSSFCSGCTHPVEHSIKVQEYFGSTHSCSSLSLQPDIFSVLSHLEGQNRRLLRAHVWLVTGGAAS